MLKKYVAPLFLTGLFLMHPVISASGKEVKSSEQMVARCEQKNAGNRVRLHLCLLSEFERQQKMADRLTDRLLGMVGRQHSLGRLKIIQWSNAITKSQSRWQKFIPWDCEWEGHVLPTAKGAAIAIDRCGIKRASNRVKHLETVFQTAQNGEKKNHE